MHLVSINAKICLALKLWFFLFKAKMSGRYNEERTSLCQNIFSTDDFSVSIFFTDSIMATTLLVCKKN